MRNETGTHFSRDKRDGVDPMSGIGFLPDHLDPSPPSFTYFPVPIAIPFLPVGLS